MSKLWKNRLTLFIAFYLCIWKFYQNFQMMTDLCAPPSWQQGRWACLPRHMTHWYGRKLNSVQLLSRVRLFATPWTAACQAYLSITNSWSLPKLMSIELVMSSNYLILCCPLLILPQLFNGFLAPLLFHFLLHLNICTRRDLSIDHLVEFQL